MATPGGCSNCAGRSKPNRFVVSIAGTCCQCGTISTGSQPCGSCAESASQNDFDCSLLSGYFELTIDPQDSCHYVYQFPRGAPGNAQTLDLRISNNPQLSRPTVNVCVSLSFGPDSHGNPVRAVSWGRTALKCCCYIGNLPRRTTNRKCCWPKEITVSPPPVPDYVAPRPRWAPEHPDDLNDSPFLPTLDGIDLFEESEYAPVRYANGEFQLRIKDISSPAFGIPWGHTRIYSNRLSNSFNFGNGTNWLIHEWPQLVSLKTNRDNGRTGCSVVLLRGTRNALWFDEYVYGDSTQWNPRFGAVHALTHDATNGLFTLYAPNGYSWEFFDFTSPCARVFAGKADEEKAAIAPGRLKRVIGPYGVANQELVATYLHCRLVSLERNGATYETGDEIRASEKFSYEYLGAFDLNAGRLQSVTLSRTTGGATQNVSRTAYAYYEKNDRNGNLGDLKTAQFYFWQQGGWASRENTLQYYAYYTDANSTYCHGMLKAVVGPESYNLMIKAGANPVTAGPDRDYADLWIEYYSDADVATGADQRTQQLLPRRIKSIAMDRGGRTHTFQYRFSTMSLDDIWTAPHNQWLCATTETRSDNNTVTVYSNAFGQSIARVLSDTASGNTWTHYLDWGSQLRELATPAASGGFKPNADGTYVPPGRPTSGARTTFLYSYPGARLGRVTIWGRNASDSESISPDEIQLHKFDYNALGQNGPVPFWILKSDENPTCVVNYEYETSIQTSGTGVTRRRAKLPEVPGYQLGSGNVTQMVTQYNQYGQTLAIVDDHSVDSSFTLYTMLGLPAKMVRTPAQVATGSAQPETTTFGADQFSRITMVKGPTHRAVVGSVLMQVQRTYWNIYDDVAGAMISAAGYQQAGSSKLMNPVAVSFYDRSGRLTDDIVAVAPTSSDPANLTLDDVPKSTWWRYRQHLYNDLNQCTERRVYFDIADGGFYSVKYAEYDALFRPTVVVAPDGTSTETTYDARSLPVDMLVGVTARQIVSSREYDNGEGGGNGDCTQITQFVGGGAPNRVISQTFNWRGQVIHAEVQNADDTSAEFEYDDASRVSSAAVLLPGPAEQESAVVPQYDARGRVFLKQYEQRSAARGTLGLPDLVMREFFGYDDFSNLAMHLPQGGTGFSKFRYDGFSRESTRFSGFSTQTLDLSAPSYSKMVVVNSADVFLEQTDTTYDEIGQPRQLVVRIQAQQDNSAQSLVKGNLTGARDTRANFSETFYDPLGRVVATANYGCAEPIAQSTSVPRPSDAILVQQTFYNDEGEIERCIDPAGNATTFLYDNAGRVTIRTEAEIRTIRTEYYGDDRIQAIYLHDLATDSSRTMATFLYGSSGAGGLPWALNSNALLAQMVDAAGAATFYGYNVQGELTSMRDARDFTHQYDRDQYGRATADRIVQVPSDLSQADVSVRLLTTEYDAKGRPTDISTYADTAGETLLTHVNRAYTFFDQVAREAQEAWGVPGGLLLSDAVYHYANDTDVFTSLDQVADRASNSIRPISIHYPTGKFLQFLYEGSASSALSRVSSIWGSEIHIAAITTSFPFASYQYAGLNDFYAVSVNPTLGAIYPFVDLNGPNGKPFGCLDQFGRITAWEWWQARIPNPKPLLQVGYQYNRNSQRTSRQLSQFGAISSKEGFGYDDLSRLDNYTRKGANALAQNWTLDAAGNWKGFDITGSQTLHQQRDYGPGDRIASVESGFNGPEWVVPAYDANGNTTTVPLGTNPEIRLRSVRYDAWNQPTSMTTSGFSVNLRYDGLGRLIWKRQQTQGAHPPYEDRRYAWSHDWRLLEEHIFTGSAPANLQETQRLEYVWGTRGMDDLICRDKYNGGLPNEPLAERRYALADLGGSLLTTYDPRLNTTSTYVQYDPYGRPYADASFSDWSQLFCGYYYDQQTGLYLVRNRIYHPQLGRWLQMDPLGLQAGLSGYEYCAGDPINLIDPTGEFFWIPFMMLAIGLPAVFAARHGASEMEEAANRGDAARYASGQRWFGWGLFGTGLAVTLPLGLLGGTAATELGLTSGSFAFSVASGAVGGSLEGTAFGGLISGVGAYSAGASGLETLGAAGEGAFWGGVSGAGFGAAFGAAGYGLRGLTSTRRGFAALPSIDRPIGDFSRSAQVLDEVLDVAQSETFIRRARGLGFSEEAIAGLPGRLRSYGGQIGEIRTGGWSDAEQFLIGRRGVFTSRWQRIAHELGHVLDDIANPGLFQRGSAAGFGFRGFYRAERAAYTMQYGFNPIPLTAFSASIQSHPYLTLAGIIAASYGASRIGRRLF